MLNMLLDLIFKISIMPQKYEHITKNIYFIQEKSVNIKKTDKCKIIREGLLIDTP